MSKFNQVIDLLKSRNCSKRAYMAYIIYDSRWEWRI
jgi:hypothetical protein